MGRRPLIAVGVLLTAIGCACSSSSSSTSSISAENTFGAAALPHTAPRSPDRGYPNIYGITPETVQVTDGHVEDNQRFEFEYAIENASKLTKLEFRIHAPHAGNLQGMELEIPADDSHQHLAFWLSARDIDLGPWVQARVLCPSGDSNWQSIGTDPTVKAPKDAPCRSSFLSCRKTRTARTG
jgi:hypothetical protein